MLVTQGFRAKRTSFPGNNMILLVVLASLTIFTSEVKAMCPTCFLGLKEICYNASFLSDLHANFRNEVVIKNMAVLDNVAYYSYEPELSDPEYAKIAYVKLDDPNIKGTLHNPDFPVSNFKTFAVDKDHSMLYLGGDTGVHTYKNGVILNVLENVEISDVYYQNHLYVVKDANKKELNSYKNNAVEVTSFPDELKNVVVTKNDDIIYLTSNGLFVKRGQETLQLSTNAFFRGFATNTNGVVYTWWADQVYEIDIKEYLVLSRVVKVLDVKFLAAIAFDKNDKMLVAVKRSLSILEPVNPVHCAP